MLAAVSSGMHRLDANDFWRIDEVCSVTIGFTCSEDALTVS